ncbi:hypothetical protein TNCV_251691 [Trichonephila clavipes]|nr:hypothetical protein TNCV_251691 [Trichonephila clavipes]
MILFRQRRERDDAPYRCRIPVSGSKTMLGVHIGAQDKGVNEFSQFAESINRNFDGKGSRLLLDLTSVDESWLQAIEGVLNKTRNSFLTSSLFTTQDIFSVINDSIAYRYGLPISAAEVQEIVDLSEPMKIAILMQILILKLLS